MYKKFIEVRKIGSRRIVNRVDEILNVCKGKKVLHLGCADYPYTTARAEGLLHKLLADVTPELWGLDASEEGVTQLKEMGFDNILLGDAEQLKKYYKAGQFDIIIAGEIIEHLGCPSAFLKSIRSIMGENTEFIITTINAFAFKLFLHSLLRNEKVHEDHNYYYSYYTLKQLLSKYGFPVADVYYYQEVRGEGMSLMVDRLLSFFTYISPVFADGLFLRARIEESGF